MQSPGPSHVVLFPEGWDRVAKIAKEAGCAVGLSQTNHIFFVNNGKRVFMIDQFGKDIHSPQQETLC